MFDASPKKSFSQFPLVWLLIAFSIGVCAAAFTEINIYICLCCLCVSAILAGYFIKRKFAFVLVLFSFTALGGFCFLTEVKSIAPDRLRVLYDTGEFVSGDPLTITGVVKRSPELTPDGFFIELETEKAVYKNAERKVSGNIRLFAAITNEQAAGEYENLNVQYGTKLRVICRLRREDQFLNPGVVSFKKLLDQKQIDATGTIKSPLLIENLGEPENKLSPLSWAFAARQNLIHDIRKYFSASTAGVLSASNLGNRYFLDKKTAGVFREGGIYHILVISGLHITFIGGLLIILVRMFTDRRWLLFLIPNVLLWIYAIVVGANAPVIRAALMFTALHFATAIYRQATLLNTLGLCGIILLIWRPSDLFDQSFQLTFLSVAAIVTTGLPLREKLKAIGEWRVGAENPLPPGCSKYLKIFCETLYWSERAWQRELSLSIWEAKLFKTTFAEILERYKLQKPLRYLFETILISTVVQLWMLPLTIVYFHRISFIAIFLNIWAGAILAIESLLAVVAICLANISESAALPVFKLTEIFNWLMISFGGWLTDNSWASFRLPHYSGNAKVIYILYFVPIIFAAIAINFWKPFGLKSNIEKAQSHKFSAVRWTVFTVFFTTLLLMIFHPFSQPVANGRLTVEFLDVGQGDAALVTMPNGETLLVDGGGKPIFNSLYAEHDNGEPEPFEPDAQGIGETVVSNFLWEKGYDQIDYILATHADADHIQGLTDVARNFRVRAALFGNLPFQNSEFAALYRVLQKRDIPAITVSKGEILNFVDSRIEILNPVKNNLTAKVSDNDSSIVLRIVVGDRKFLLTGDIENETENRLAAGADTVEADVVKVAHHGSRTSSTQNFINAVKAKLAVISVGKASPFGHPKPEIVDRWKWSEVKVLTTGENGTISVSTDGKDLQLNTFTEQIIYR